MATRNESPLFERKDPKHGALLSLDDREDRCNKRYKPVKLKLSVARLVLS